MTPAPHASSRVRFTPLQVSSWAAEMEGPALPGAHPAAAAGCALACVPLAWPGSAEYAATALGIPGRLRPVPGLAPGPEEGLLLLGRPGLLRPEHRDSGLGWPGMAGSNAVDDLLRALERAGPEGGTLTVDAPRARRLLLALQAWDAFWDPWAAELVRAEVSGQGQEAAWGALGLQVGGQALHGRGASGASGVRVSRGSAMITPARFLAAATAPEGESVHKVGTERVRAARRGDLVALHWKVESAGITGTGNLREARRSGVILTSRSAVRADRNNGAHRLQYLQAPPEIQVQAHENALREETLATLARMGEHLDGSADRAAELSRLLLASPAYAPLSPADWEADIARRLAQAGMGRGRHAAQEDWA